MERKVDGISKGAGLLAGLGDAKKKKISSSFSFLMPAEPQVTRYRF